MRCFYGVEGLTLTVLPQHAAADNIDQRYVALDNDRRDQAAAHVAVLADACALSGAVVTVLYTHVHALRPDGGLHGQRMQHLQNSSREPRFPF